MNLIIITIFNLLPLSFLWEYHQTRRKCLNPAVFLWVTLFGPSENWFFIKNTHYLSPYEYIAGLNWSFPLNNFVPPVRDPVSHKITLFHVGRHFKKSVIFTFLRIRLFLMWDI